MENLKICPVILAGGSGTRFWPLSRKDSPKQVLNLSGHDTLIGEAVTRFLPIAPEEQIHILTTDRNISRVRGALPGSSKVSYIAEPLPRGTAACVLLAALKLHKRHGDCVLCVSPSDHYISDQEAFTQTVCAAVECATERESLVTIGIKPSFPSTGYGYICCNYSVKAGAAFEVSDFVEKPPLARAKEYLAGGNYFWNSGIFIFRSSVIIESFRRFLPRIYDKIYTCYPYLNTESEGTYLLDPYKSVQNISLDYGIIERSNEVYVVPAEMGWNDIGSWDSLGCIFPTDAKGNIVKAPTVNIDTQNCVIYSDKALIATIGVEDMIIVNCNDALLICPKADAQRVKEIVDKLERENLRQYL